MVRYGDNLAVTRTCQTRFPLESVEPRDEALRLHHLLELLH